MPNSAFLVQVAQGVYATSGAVKLARNLGIDLATEELPKDAEYWTVSHLVERVWFEDEDRDDDYAYGHGDAGHPDNYGDK